MKTKTLEQLIKKIKSFTKARGWNPVPADLAKSTVIEAAELLEKFQWDESNKQIKGVKTKKNIEEIGEEVADIFIYLAEFCEATGIKLNKVIQDKITKNEAKYPAEMFKGKHNPKFYISQKLKYREQRKKE